MSVTRSDSRKSLIKYDSLPDNVLPTNGNVLNHYHHLRKELTKTDPRFFKVLPSFLDVKQKLISDIFGIWLKAGLPVISEVRVVSKFKKILNQFKTARKKAVNLNEQEIKEAWLDLLFDISKCKCPIPPKPNVYNGKLSCLCAWEDRIPEEEIFFLQDQRSDRKMFISSSRDKVFENKVMTRRMHKALPQVPSDVQIRSTSYQKDSSAVILGSKLRPRDTLKSDTSYAEELVSDSKDPEFVPKPVTGGKMYIKKRKISISTKSCLLADKRHTSIRQQADQILSFPHADIAGSPSTVYRSREKTRLFSLETCESNINDSDYLQLHYDGRIINGMDRYVFVVQFWSKESEKRAERVIGVKSFSPETSVNSEAVFRAITTDEACGRKMGKIYSVMSDTTSMNTGRKTGVNKRLRDYISVNFKHDAHALECMFHVNEIYLSHVIKEVEGKSKGPQALGDGALLNKIRSIRNCSPHNLIDRQAINVPITPIAQLHLRSKIEWFSEQKRLSNSCDDFRSDQMCLLVLSCQLLMDVPENLTHLLWYKQEQVCHSRWLTTANGYLRLLLFGSNELHAEEKNKLYRLVSYIVSVYLPSFLMIHLNPRASEGPRLTLFQRDLLLAYEVVDPGLCEVVKRYFIQHAFSWLSPHNIALSLYSENPPFTKEVLISLSSLPEEIAREGLLLTRGTNLKDFFTVASKSAPCVLFGSTEFWKCIDNHNRCNEREIGKLKDLLHRKKIRDNSSQQQRTDIRLRSYLCSSQTLSGVELLES